MTDNNKKLIKTQYGHLFEVTENGNLIFKPQKEISKFKLVYVKGGKFTMGDGEKNWDESKRTKHEVELSDFFMAEFPVTQEFYREVTDKSPSRFKGDNKPVEKVSWYDAVEFCKKLNNMLKLEQAYTGEKDETKCNFKATAFRLPTEAEWEYAASYSPFEGGRGDVPFKRGKEDFLYAGSNNINDVAWYEKNCEDETKPVGLKFPNALGIYDMSGNVYEWCWDWYDKDFYKKSGGTLNPRNSEKGSARVMRGGSWYYGAVYCRAAFRISFTPDYDDDVLGFRFLFAFQFPLSQVQKVNLS